MATDMPPAADPVLLPALRPALMPATQPVTHTRYRAVGLATGLGILGGAGIALLGVVIGLRAQGPTTTTVRVEAPAAPSLGGVRVEYIPAVGLPANQGAGPVAATPASPMWASHAIAASSQYSDTNWSMRQALGAPDTYPRHGDLNTAWASRAPDAEGEFLEVGFDRPVRIRAVIVAETFNPGAITAITAGLASGSRQVLVREGVTPITAMGGEYAAQLHRFDLRGCTAEPIASIRIDLDSAAVPGWNEIDAIGVEPCD